ncbi:protein PTST homolog 2, chloroplastic isoform X2 [Jatropha curcas]|uniref:protein PTST homolog 2, chloroplastic isoform X2 n=1 Tax=Jatropha curcas TaxID=180498 RepID=UPI0005FBFC11|nr:protein PTST homolog 2, chloroplastic isoform X2 [Jatropha curcas]
MLSFTTVPTHIFVSPNSFADLSRNYFRLNLFEGRSRNRERLMDLHFVAGRESCSLLGFLDAKNRNYRDCFWSCGGFARRCKTGWKSEEDFALEAEILEYMKNSEKPEAFPSKKQLIDAGRVDLVEAILTQGGWVASGWDSDVNLNGEEEVIYNVDTNWGLVTDNECNAERVQEGHEEWNSEASSFDVGNGSYPSPSSSGRSLETAAENDSGIEGILSRLEKERNISFGFGLQERTGDTGVQSNDVSHNSPAKSTKNATVGVAALERNKGTASSNPTNGIVNGLEGNMNHRTSLSNIDGFGKSLKPDAWRTWSIRRTGFSGMEFEGGEVDCLRDEILETRESTIASLNGRKVNSSHERIKYNQIRSRLQHLESELSSVLNALKSNADENALEKVESSDDDFLKLSDAWEFQENEIMTAQAKLRAIRAKLAILEGKTAHALINAQKIAEEKQRRIDDARRALGLLRTACIVWPNSASEVLLAGSFDGWTTKRKMQKSSTGVFSLCLKLYTGKYQIKFIVDGEWRIDPLRPIVRDDGFENNLLIVS